LEEDAGGEIERLPPTQQPVNIHKPASLSYLAKFMPGLMRTLPISKAHWRTASRQQQSTPKEICSQFAIRSWNLAFALRTPIDLPKAALIVFGVITSAMGPCERISPFRKTSALLKQGNISST
jgi:hypothetical protein